MDKFKAEKTFVGTGDKRKRAIRFTIDNLGRKKIDYDAPDKIEILPYNMNVSSGPDSFDSVLLEDGYGTDVGDKSGTLGTPGTLSGGKDGDNDTQTSEEIEYKNRVVESENDPIHSKKMSSPS